MPVTRKQLRQEILKRLYPTRFPLVSTTTALGLTTQLIDAALEAGGEDEDYIRAWVYIAEQVPSGPAVGEVARVRNVTYGPTQMSLTVAPAFSGPVQSGTEYELHYELHPGFLHERINEILENLRHDVYVPLTLVDDGEMLSPDTTSWAAGGATLSKDQTQDLSTPYPLKVITTVASGGAISTVFKVRPGTNVLVVTSVLLTEGNVKVSLEDETNFVDIETGQTDVLGRHIIAFTGAVPSTCEKASVILTNAGTAASTFYVEWVAVIPADQQEWSLPSNINVEDVVNVVQLPYGTGIGTSGSDNAYAAEAGEYEHFAHVKTVDQEESASGAPRLFLPRKPGKYPLFIRATKAYPTFSNDTDVIDAPKDIVRDLVLATTLEELAIAASAIGNIERAEVLAARARQVREETAIQFRRKYRLQGTVRGAGH